MQRRQPLPPWLQALYEEMVKPPYFLQPQMQQSAHSESATSQKTEKPSSNAQEDAQEEIDGNKKHAPNKPSSPDRTKGAKSHTKSDLYVPTPVLSRYPLEVSHKQYLDGILKIETENNERYAIKHTPITTQRVRFIHRILKYGKQQGFTRYAPFVLSKKKSPAVLYDGNVYYATEWVDGQPANFASTEHVAQVAYSLAQLHEATRGYHSDSYSPESAFNLFQLTKQRNRDLHQLVYRTEAKKNKDAFDDLLLSLKDDLFTDASESLQLLQHADCEAFLADDEGNPGLCHLDVIPGNCIYTPGRHVCLIDFDLATFAPRALDMGHLLRRSLERSNWNGDMAYATFLHFDTVKSIPKVEYRLVEAIVRFPYQAWRVAHTRYHYVADEGQLDALQQYADQSQRRKTFLTSLANQVDRLSTGGSE